MRYMEPQILKPNRKKRSGRGFSREELKKAGLNKTEAARIDVPVDFRRRTVHEENIEVIKAYTEKKSYNASVH